MSTANGHTAEPLSSTAAISEAVMEAKVVNLATPTIATTWALGAPEDSKPLAKARARLMRHNPAELVIRPDDRTRVAPEHFAPGGKYRG